jgi:hypothetical protein
MTEYASLREKIAAEKLVRSERYGRFETVWKRAKAAGLTAGEARTPQPIVVTGEIGPDAGAQYYVPEGCCGFAWIKVRPGNSSFAKWLVKTGKARASYGGGVQIWVNEHNQSVERKQAHAEKLAEVLRAELGVDAYADSRLD